MMNKMKSKRSALILGNLMGMITGMGIGIAAACMMKKYIADKHSLRSKAKRAFRTIEDKISM